MVGLVHNLCEPGFFGDSKFVGLIAGSFQRWVVGYLRDFSCFLLVGSLLFWAVGYFQLVSSSS